MKYWNLGILVSGTIWAISGCLQSACGQSATDEYTSAAAATADAEPADAADAADAAADAAATHDPADDSSSSGAALVLRDGPLDQATVKKADDACRTGGNSRACFALAYAYEKGYADGVRDLGASKKYYGSACRQGEVAACFNLANNELSGAFPATADEMSQAISLLRRGCESSHLGSCHNYGMIERQFANGAAEGAWALDRACELGSAQSCYEVGRMYLTGAGDRTGDGALNQDPQRAHGYFLKACEGGFEAACNVRQ